jgi:formate hydrogenlyase subunit 3/multisubunit Na+/H+ antiporter MnhD subunit
MLLTPPALLLLAALLPAALLARLDPGRLPVLACGGAVGLAVVAVATGQATPLVAVCLLLSTVLALVVAVFSRRHLDGDVAQRSYDRSLLLTAGSAVLAFTADDLVLLALAWVATGTGISRLVAHHRGVPATARAAAALRRARLVGDSALVASLALLCAGAGSTRLEDVLTWAGSADDPLVLVAGVLLLVAVAARSGQLPLSRWLPLSVVAPAPVSALLHAGIVNAPIVLLVRLEPVWEPHAALVVGLFALGTATAVATFPRLLVRADVKSRLAWSTTAQMGFALALVAVGAHAAAVLHVVLHGVYKAAAFLVAGDQLSRARRDRLPVTGPVTRRRGAVGGGLVALGLLAVDGGWQHPLSATAVVVAGAAAGWGLMSLRTSTATRAAAAAAVTAAAAVVLAAAHGMAGLLDVRSPPTGRWPGPAPASSRRSPSPAPSCAAGSRCAPGPGCTGSRTRSRTAPGPSLRCRPWRAGRSSTPPSCGRSSAPPRTCRRRGAGRRSSPPTPCRACTTGRTPTRCALRRRADGRRSPGCRRVRRRSPTPSTTSWPAGWPPGPASATSRGARPGASSGCGTGSGRWRPTTPSCATPVPGCVSSRPTRATSSPTRR